MQSVGIARRLGMAATILFMAVGGIIGFLCVLVTWEKL